MVVDAVVALAAGASTGIIADVILFPLDFLKTRAQGKTTAHAAAAAVPNGPKAAAARVTSALPDSASALAAPSRQASSPSCGMRGGRRPGGLSACYSGIAALAMGSMPSSAGFFVVYEVAKENLKRTGRFLVRRH